MRWCFIKLAFGAVWWSWRRRALPRRNESCGHCAQSCALAWALVFPSIVLTLSLKASIQSCRCAWLLSRADYPKLASVNSLLRRSDYSSLLDVLATLLHGDASNLRESKRPSKRGGELGPFAYKIFGTFYNAIHWNILWFESSEVCCVFLRYVWCSSGCSCHCKRNSVSSLYWLWIKVSLFFNRLTPFVLVFISTKSQSLTYSYAASHTA